MALAVLGLVAGCSGETVGPNRAPVAIAGPDQAADLLQPVELDGSGSYDPEGAQLTYRWDLVAVPADGTAELSSATGATTGLTPDAVGIWVIRLTVNDGSLDSEPDVVKVQASGEPCTDDSECDDGSYCTGVEACVDGWCRPGSLDCSAEADQCNDGGCDEDSDVCIPVPKSDGTACDDGLWCTENDGCQGGACTGDARDCSSMAAECVAGVCNEAAQICESRPMADGDLCDDGQYCSVNSRCSGGQCLGGEPRDCSSAAGGCVDGICDEEQDACVGDPLISGTPCNDDLFCTVNDACDGLGNCVGTTRDCSSLTNQCNQGTCDETGDQCVASPINPGQACDDGLYCTLGETCQTGSCVSAQARDCDDGDPCTNDSCDEAGDACANLLVPRPGEEGPYGNANCGDTVDNDCDRAVDGADPDCQQCQSNPDCDDGNPCTVNTCNADNTCLTSFVTNGTLCDDGLYCTNPDQCLDGVCSGDPLNCSGLDDQCNQGSCDENGDQCVANPINQGQACDDGLYCNVNETCQNGSCTSSETRDCSGESDQCNDGFCNEGMDRCEKLPINEGQPCNDFLFCTTPDACSGGTCTGPQRNCTGAGDQCNDGVCDEDLDSCEPQPKAGGTPCDDGFYCTESDACNDSGNCVGSGDPCTTECLTSCNDTTDQCEPTPSGTPCTDDGLYCNGDEECDGAGNCSGTTSPCPETTCNTCQEDTDSCHDPAGTPCPDDGQYCNGAEECDGAGVCDHAGDPCQAGETCDEDTDTCVGLTCTSDEDCPTVGDLCRPQCSLDEFGCVTPPASMDLTCVHPVDLANTDVSNCTIQLGLTGQDGCLSCTSKVGLVLVDYTDFQGCASNGWTLVSGDYCSDSVDNCSLGGSQIRTCCDRFDTLCNVFAGNTSLRTDENLNCGGGHEEWRLEKTYDFSGLSSLQVCLDIADVNANDHQAIMLYAYDGSNGPDQILCQLDEPQEGVDGVFYRYCSSTLNSWANDNSSVTIRIIGHSENGGRMMFIDNVAVKGWAQGCAPSYSTVFTEDFNGCPDPLTNGWNGWTVTGTIKCPTGFNCYDGSSRAEADATAGTFERYLDASSLDGDVRLCFHFGDTGGSIGKNLLVEFDPGTGWRTAFAQAGNPGPDNSCREICVNLSELDPAVNRNPWLGIRFDMGTTNDKIDVDHITLSGAQFCDGAGTINFSSFGEPAQGTYTFTAQDVPGTPVDAFIDCAWDTPDPGQEVEDDAFVAYRNPLNGWTRRRMLSLDNTGQGRALVHFPVMIKLDSTRIDYNRTQDNGEDLRFVDADLRRILPHEIEVWNESGDSVVWVAVPHIPASTKDHIWMYYGNPSSPDGQNPQGVWDRFYQGVWHLAETGGGTAYDSTINRNHGTYRNGCVLNQLGEHGDIAVAFDGSDDYVDLGGLDIVGASGDNGITIETYAMEYNATAEERLMSKSDGAGEDDHWWMLSLSNGSRLRFRLMLNGNTYTLVANSGNVTSRDWFYGAAAYTGAGMQLFFKGTLAGSNTRTGTISTDAGKIARIGSNHSEYQAWDGLISEVRISNIGRNQAWIRAQNLSLTDSYVTYGLEESF